MTNGSEDSSRKEKITRRAQQNEPVVDTVALDMLAEMNLPLRGELRQNVIMRLRENLRQRRTVEGLSQRIASRAVQPINAAITEEAQERTKNRVEDRLQSIAEKRGSSE